MKHRSISLLREAAWTALLVCLLACSGAAQAQWVWRDANGNTTYSDSPPPANIRPDAILRRPGALLPPDAGRSSADTAGRGTTAADGAAQPDQPNSKAGNVPKTLAEQDAEFRKRREERLKAEQKQAEDDAKAAERQATCAQARGYLDMVQSGTRLMRPNPDGTRGFIDDQQRGAEVQKAQESIAKNCD